MGGPFFDVLDGEYRIENVAPGRLLLHLRSTHRLSTTFNAYSGLWTDFILRDVQTAILEVLKRRCEGRERHAVTRDPGQRFSGRVDMRHSRS